jgi:hypothetical protein
VHAAGRDENLVQVVVEASGAGAGLLALALTLGVIFGLSLGVETLRPGALVPRRLYATGSRWLIERVPGSPGDGRP